MNIEAQFQDHFRRDTEAFLAGAEFAAIALKAFVDGMKEAAVDSKARELAKVMTEGMKENGK